MTADLQLVLRSLKQRVDGQLAQQYRNSTDSAHHNPLADELHQACLYSLTIGGKRLRPALVYLAAQTITGDIEPTPALDKVASAVEMLHTYSLIHDDLPAMDNDDLRRGQPSCHKAFNEATAILAGDALLTRAFELLAQVSSISPQQQIDLVRTLASATGPSGMVAGQAIDMKATDRDINLSELQAMHALKTGALITASVVMGGIVSGASTQQLELFGQYGKHIGLAFQIADDILDIESDSQALGKTQGKDGAANKATYVKLLGLAGAKKAATEAVTEAEKALTSFGSEAQQLRMLAHYTIERKN